MPGTDLIDDLYRHNDWANGHLIHLCDGLSDAQLDQAREMGFGSLRATLFHILAAEEIWMERWAGEPWRPFSFEPLGTTIAEIADRLSAVSERRRQLMDADRESRWQRLVTYQNSKREPATRKLDDLLLHVANHGIHHRAQALHFLKQFGRTLPVGSDYLVFRLAYSSLKQDPEVVQNMQNIGLEVEIGPGSHVDFDLAKIQRYFAYFDWANQLLLSSAEALDDAALDQDFGIGPGTLRKTFQHLLNVEPHWLKIWGIEPCVPGSATGSHEAGSASIAQIRENWRLLAAQRNAFIQSLDSAEADRMILLSVGGPPMKFPLLQSVIQLVTHGTHHRAQISNMLRQNGIKPPGLDFVGWVMELDR